MPLHEFRSERLVSQGLLALFRSSVEDDALAENGRHEGIGRRLVELFIAAPEKSLLGLLAHHHDHPVAREVDLSQFPQLVAHPLKKRDGILAKGCKVPEQGPTPLEQGCRKTFRRHDELRARSEAQQSPGRRLNSAGATERQDHWKHRGRWRSGMRS